MKTNIRLLPIAAILLAASCQKEGRPLVISADSETESRSAIAENNCIVWEDGDRISVFDGTANREFVLSSGAGQTRGMFSGSVAAHTISIYAVAPYTASATLSGSTVSGLELPSAQSAVEGSYDSEAALATAFSADPESVHFCHLSSFVKFTLGFACSSVTLSSNDGTLLAGRISVSVGDDGIAGSPNVIYGGSSQVTLSGNLKEGSTYVIALLPGTCPNGISVDVTASDNTRYTRVKNSSATFQSGHIYNLGSFRTNGEWNSITSGTPVESVSLSRSAFGMLEGKTYLLQAGITPSAAATSTVTWTSSDDAVASVSKGVVTAHKPGCCTVTATAGGVSSSCTVTVVASSSTVFRYGYSELTDKNKKLYDLMLETILDFRATSSGNYSPQSVTPDYESLGYYPDFSVIQHVLHCIWTDVPEAFLLYSSIPYYDGSIRLGAPYQMSPEKYATYMSTIYAERDKILAHIPSGASDYEKAKILHDSFIKLVNYGDVTGGNSGNLIGGFVNKRVVCEGYSRCYLFLCQQAGLDAIYIGGSLQTSSSTDTWTNHAWNHVMVDGKWYMCDLTSDGGLVGGSVGYRFFLVGQTAATNIHRYTSVDGTDPNTGSYRYYSLPSLSTDSYAD